MINITNQKILVLTKIPKDKKIQKILKDEQIWESIRLIKKINQNILIITELKALLYSSDIQKLWQHDCHYDPIINAEIKNNTIKITEFDGTTYTLNLETGKEINSNKPKKDINRYKILTHRTIEKIKK